MTVDGNTVSEDEFNQFIAGYPHELHRDICGIAEPPLVSYSDDAGNIVASCHKQNRDEAGNIAPPFLCGFKIYDGIDK